MRKHFEYLAWPRGERDEWDESFPQDHRLRNASDADSEGSGVAGPIPSPQRSPSELSSSNEGPLSENEGRDSEDDAQVVAAVAEQLPPEPDAPPESTDSECDWSRPTYWGYPLVRYAAWFTVHAVRGDGKLLRGRPRGQLHLDASGPVDEWPECKVCQARVRAAAVSRKEGTEEAAENDLNDEGYDEAEDAESEPPSHDPIIDAASEGEAEAAGSTPR